MTTPRRDGSNEGAAVLDQSAGIDPALWDVLACPCPAHGDVTHDANLGEIVCTVCGLRFPIRDGIPVMLLDEARKS